MARKWGRIVSITALVVIVITGIVVGVLFAVGVLHTHKSSGTSPTPTNNSGNVINPGYVQIYNVKNMGGECVPPGPCQGSTGIGYSFQSDCFAKNGDIDACSTVIDFGLAYPDGTTATSTRSFDGYASSGGTFELFFRDISYGTIGQTKIPSSVSLTGYSIYRGVKGEKSAPVNINL